MQDLTWRFEYKYCISRPAAEALEKVVRSLGFVSDMHSVGGEYPVTSIYFDSPGLYDFYDKAGGFLKRKKIRARIYTPWQDNNSDDFWFEIKWRKNLLTAKDRVRLSRAEWELIQRGEYNRVVSSAREENREVLSRMAGFLIGGSMQPTVLVHYVRRPLIMNKNELVRINFDRSITACEKRDFWYTPFMVRVLPEEQVILEIKFSTTIPEWLPDIVRSFGLSRVSYSKYFEALSSVRALRPLPR
jgi:hypothetical protein